MHIFSSAFFYYNVGKIEKQYKKRVYGWKVIAITNYIEKIYTKQLRYRSDFKKKYAIFQ